MTVALYMDEHIHSSITVGLRFREVDVLTVHYCDSVLRDRSNFVLLG